MAELIITLESNEKHYSFEDLGITFDSTPEEVLNALQPIVLEEFGVNIKEDEENLFTVKKIEESGNIFCFPKSPAGLDN